jgi:hypothetical protein
LLAAPIAATQAGNPVGDTDETTHRERLRCIDFHPVTSADRVAVAIDVVDAADRRPEFVFLKPRRRERGLFARVRTGPVVGGNRVRGVRRVFQRVVLLVHLAGFDRPAFAVNGNHRVAEPVEFGLRFALRWLDHHRARDRPAQRRRVKAVIHQPLGDVFRRDALEFAQIENALVRDEMAVTLVERREIFLQTLRDVIRVEDRDLRCFGQTGGAHRGDVNPRDGEDAGTAPGRSGDSADRLEFNLQFVASAR